MLKQTSPAEEERKPEKSRYERLGGVNAIAMVVDRFSDEIVKNPKLNVNPALREWNKTGKLPGLKFMREAHKDLHLTSAEFDEVGPEIGRRSTTSKCRRAKSRSYWPPSSRGRRK